MYCKNFLRYLSFFILISYSNPTWANQSILFIDMNYLMNNSIAGKSIFNQLKKRNESNIINFKKTEKDLQSEESKIISQKNILNVKEYQNKVNNFQKKVSKYQTERNNKNENLSKQKIKAQQKLLNAINPILKDYSKNNSVSYILPKKSIIIGQSDLDITKKIILLLDKSIKKININ
jgi:Skp family chaperone for outer membrane proteins